MRARPRRSGRDPRPAGYPAATPQDADVGADLRLGPGPRPRRASRSFLVGSLPDRRRARQPEPPAYSFTRVLQDGSPVRWNPCRPMSFHLRRETPMPGPPRRWRWSARPSTASGATPASSSSTREPRSDANAALHDGVGEASTRRTRRQVGGLSRLLDELCAKAGRDRPIQRQVQIWARDLDPTEGRSQIEQFADSGADTLVLVLVEERGADGIRRLADRVVGVVPKFARSRITTRDWRPRSILEAEPHCLVAPAALGGRLRGSA